jgi:hypothetical protein
LLETRRAAALRESCSFKRAFKLLLKADLSSSNALLRPLRSRMEMGRQRLCRDRCLQRRLIESVSSAVVSLLLAKLGFADERLDVPRLPFEKRVNRCFVAHR